MNLSTTERLSLIESHLRKLLEIAEKRAQGKWICHDGDTWDENGVSIISSHDDDTSAYIASCAGNAEAGWKSTLAAIAGCKEVIGCFDAAIAEGLNERIGELEREVGSLNDLVTRRLLFAYDAAKAQLNEILAAYPIELLQ